jgi:hypothetical protein
MMKISKKSRAARASLQSSPSSLEKAAGKGARSSTPVGCDQEQDINYKQDENFKQGW